MYFSLSRSQPNHAVLTSTIIIFVNRVPRILSRFFSRLPNKLLVRYSIVLNDNLKNCFKTDVVVKSFLN